jgi:hypothetical protein
MKRRDVLAGGIFGSLFALFDKAEGSVTPEEPLRIKDDILYPNYEIPGCGKILTCVFSNDVHTDWIDINPKTCGLYHKYVKFPVESRLTITCEFGEVVFVGFNFKYEGNEKIGLSEVFDDITNDTFDTMILKIRGQKFRIATIISEQYEDNKNSLFEFKEIRTTYKPVVRWDRTYGNKLEGY